MASDALEILVLCKSLEVQYETILITRVQMARGTRKSVSQAKTPPKIKWFGASIFATFLRVSPGTFIEGNSNKFVAESSVCHSSILLPSTLPPTLSPLFFILCTQTLRLRILHLAVFSSRAHQSRL
jgi:hypothetical protein